MNFLGSKYYYSRYINDAKVVVSNFIRRFYKLSSAKLKKIKRGLLLLGRGKLDLFFYKIKKIVGLKNIIPPLPPSLIIEPINVCNLHCPTCPTGAGQLKRPPRAMTLEEFKRIIDEIRGYAWKLVLFNYGEPLLHKNIAEMIEYAVAADLSVQISTNGISLDRLEFCEKIIRSGLHKLIITLDGINQETAQKVRRGVNFDKIIDGIKNAVSIKKRLGLANPIIELIFLTTRYNENQITEAKELGKNLGVDSFLQKTISILDHHDRELAAEFLPSDLSLSRYTKINDKFELRGEMVNGCDWMHNRTVILSDGSVVPCCNDADGDHIMGNVFRQNLKKIWLGQKYNEFRRRVETNKKSISMCHFCSEKRDVKLSARNKL